MSPGVRAFWRLSLWEWALVSAVVLVFVQFFWLPQDMFFSPDSSSRREHAPMKKTGGTKTPPVLLCVE